MPQTSPYIFHGADVPYFSGKVHWDLVASSLEAEIEHP